VIYLNLIKEICKKHSFKYSELSTIYKQNNLRYLVDLNLAYTSNRYSNQRIRVLEDVYNTDICLFLFDGIGCFSLPACKKVKFVYGLDYNPNAKILVRINQKLK
jgi:tRNA G37 N-methylase Trm5